MERVGSGRGRTVAGMAGFFALLWGWALLAWLLRLPDGTPTALASGLGLMVLPVVGYLAGTTAWTLGVERRLPGRPRLRRRAGRPTRAEEVAAFSTCCLWVPLLLLTGGRPFAWSQTITARVLGIPDTGWTLPNAAEPLALALGMTALIVVFTVIRGTVLAVLRRHHYDDLMVPSSPPPEPDPAWGRYRQRIAQQGDRRPLFRDDRDPVR